MHATRRRTRVIRDKPDNGILRGIQTKRDNIADRRVRIVWLCPPSRLNDGERMSVQVHRVSVTMKFEIRIE